VNPGHHNYDGVDPCFLGHAAQGSDYIIGFIALNFSEINI
jgi:hypothetical protein